MMRVSCRNVILLAIGAVVLLLMAGCPLPYDFSGRGPGTSHSTDPSSPKMTAPVTASYSEQGGASGQIADGGSFVSGKTTTVTLSTITPNSDIYYTDDGSALTTLGSARRFSASSGSITITRTTTPQSVDIHALAIGPDMLPSLPIHVVVSVSPYPILSVTCDKTSVTEDNGTATFTITSSAASSSDMTVNLVTGGDYSTQYVTGFVQSGSQYGPGSTLTPTLVHGTTSVTFTITTTHDPSTASHTATLTIQADLSSTPAYTVGVPSSASLTIQDDGKYALTVASGGNGTTSPSGQISVSPGAATSITAAANLHFYFLNWTVASGSGVTFGSTGTATSTSISDTVTLTAGNATVQANFAALPDLYVNAGTGNDSNAGTSSTSAFKTITKALSVAVLGQNINVAAGTYDTANGETFPLYIPAGVSLTGNESNKGSSTIILGGGTPTVYAPSYISNAVVMGSGSVLAGFTITNNSGLGSFPMGVLVHSGYSANNVIIRNNTIINNPAEGVYVVGGSGGVITANTFSGNGSGGLVFVQGGGAGMSVSYNSFSDLFEMDTLGPDLGGGAAGSPGHNSFLGGTNPTYFGSGGTVYAENNHWNNNPPTVGAWLGGFDVGIANGTTVVTTGSY
jgi:parallel beta-helix repeat protein